MRLLFVHQNFPGQFTHLARHCARDRGHSVVTIGQETNLARNQSEIGAIRCVSYAAPRLPPSPVHRYLRGAEIAKRRSEMVRDAADGLKSDRRAARHRAGC
jgi:hypothetical protein